ncbi:MAG: hypothetical protein ACFFCS_16195 [Candidatus Hodarchaeota archaeon]
MTNGLNWSSETIAIFISTVPITIAFFVGWYNLTRRKQRGSFYFMFMCFFLIFSFIFFGLAILLENDLIAQIFCPIFGSLSTIAQLFHIDSISRETVNPFKMGIVAFLGTGSIVTVIATSSVIMILDPAHLEEILSRGEIFFINYMFLIAFQFYSMFTWIYYGIKIHKNAPSNLKAVTRMNLIGVWAMVGASFWSSFSNIFSNMFPASAFADFAKIFRWEFIFGVAFLTIAMAYAKKPVIAQILPFKAQRLSVININSGIMLFNYSWSKKDSLVNNELFSGMLSGISMILNEAVKEGNVQEIHLDNAILLLKSSDKYPVACVLVAARSSRSLRDSLDTFAGMFFEEFAGELEGDVNEVTKFRPATSIISRCFPFTADARSETLEGVE